MNLPKLKGKSRNPLSGITNKNAAENKTTPGTSNNVKKLFTPCRRVGLNRNKNSKNLIPVLNESTTSTPYGSYNDVSDVQQDSSELGIVNNIVINNKSPQQCVDELSTEFVKEQNTKDVNTKYDEKLVLFEARVQLEDILLREDVTPRKTSNNKRKVKEVHDSNAVEQSKSNSENKKLKKQKLIVDSLNDVGTIEDDLMLINQGIPIHNMSKNEKAQVEQSAYKSNNSTANSSPRKSQKSSIQQSQSQESSIPSQSQETTTTTSYDEQELPNITETPRSNQYTSEDESLLYNCDMSDFGHASDRRKKKKSVSGKHKKHSSKASSSSKQKQDVSEARSAVSTTYDSDSDDDFLVKPKREKRSSISLKKDSNNQSSIKNEVGNTDDKKKLKKMKKNPVVDELNRTEHIRIAENKSYTIVHKGNIISYVKSHDNDVDMKTTESDDNQQPPSNYEIPVTQKSMIIERKDYKTEQLNATPEIETKSGYITSMFDDVLKNAGKNKQLLSSDMKIHKAKKNKNVNESSTPQRTNNAKHSPVTKVNIHRNSNPYETLKQSQITVKSVKSLSSEVQEKPATNELPDKLDLVKIKKEALTMETALKVKQDRLARLQRVSVYKRTHDLQALRAVTLRMKRGCQEALIDLLLVLKEHSNEEFDMGTLLHNMKIPNELVGYNEEDDNFV
ncbi:hypothetical protein CBL_00584 [Carabus blaptoides fortunei]